MVFSTIWLYEQQLLWSCETSSQAAFIFMSCELYYRFSPILSPLRSLPHSPTLHLWLPLSHARVALDVQQISTKWGSEKFRQPQKHSRPASCLHFKLRRSQDVFQGDVVTMGIAGGAALSEHTLNEMNESDSWHCVVVVNINCNALNEDTGIFQKNRSDSLPVEESCYTWIPYYWFLVGLVIKKWHYILLYYIK